MGITGDVLLMLRTLLLVSLFLHVLDRCILKLFMVFYSNTMVRMKITHKPFSSTISNWECSNNSQVFSPCINCIPVSLAVSTFILYYSYEFIILLLTAAHPFHFNSLLLLSRKKHCFQSVLS